MTAGTGAIAAAPPRSTLHRAEDACLTVMLVLTVALPIAEIVLRALWHVGIQGVATLVQHATLAAGMAGAAIAARERRLLTLATAGRLRGTAGRVAELVAGGVAAAVALLFALACVDFVAAEREGGSPLVYGLPAWIAQLPLPAGFALVAWRLLRHAAPDARGRIVAAAGACLAVAAYRLHWIEAGDPLLPALAVLVVATLCGAPVFAALGGIAIVLQHADGVPVAALAVNHYGLVTNPTLPALPLFTLAGYLLAESRAPQRLLEVFDALFGRMRGGASLVTVLACTFFTSFTGASGVAILTLGGLVMPLLTGAGMKPAGALGLVTAAGLPGVLLMPALPLLLYAIVAGTGIQDMFLAGLLPALLTLAILLAWGMRRPLDAPTVAVPFSRSRAVRALSAAKWELLLPLVPLIALATSLATPVEAAAFTTACALVLVTVVHRDLSIRRELPRVAAECGLVTGGILLVLGVALSLTNHMVDAELPVRIVDWVTGHVGSRWVFLAALNLALLAAGCVMDIFTAIVVLVPLVAPLGAAYGIHPIHLGIVFLANLEIGYLTPPVGMNLFFAASRFGHPIGEVFAAVVPVLLLLAAALVVITCVPWFSTVLL